MEKYIVSPVYFEQPRWAVAAKKPDGTLEVFELFDTEAEATRCCAALNAAAAVFDGGKPGIPFAALSGSAPQSEDECAAEWAQVCAEYGLRAEEMFGG